MIGNTGDEDLLSSPIRGKAARGLLEQSEHERVVGWYRLMAEEMCLKYN